MIVIIYIDIIFNQERGVMVMKKFIIPETRLVKDNITLEDTIVNFINYLNNHNVVEEKK